MANMKDEDLLRIADIAVADSTIADSTFLRINEDLLDRYEGNPYGDELPNRSKVVSNDVMDTVEADMPAHARIFLGVGEILKFKPNKKSNPEDVKEAELKTKYVDWQIREQPWSFPVLHGWIKNAEIQKVAAVKYFMEETEEVETHKVKGYSSEEMVIFEESLQGEDVESVDITERSKEGEGGRMDVTFKVKKSRKAVKIKNIKLERFIMTSNAESKETAEVVGDREIITRGELLKRGVDRSLISKITAVGAIDEEESRLEDIRDADEGGSDDNAVFSDWALEKVELENLYIMADYDQDGIAERRELIRSGDVIISNEVFNHVPYAIMSTLLMPHKAIGKSRAEITAPTAKLKTAVMRGMQDNIYAVNNVGMAVSNKVNMDDLMVNRPQRIVRMKDGSDPSAAMLPLVTPSIVGEALLVIQYLDAAKAQTTGSMQASQGLTADEIGQETAARFNGVDKSLKAKMELVARVVAETGFRQLYEGVAWIDANYQDTETEVEILGEELAVNPADWEFSHNISSNVGLSIGDEDRMLQTMTGFLQISQQLKQTGSSITDESKVYNMLDEVTKASDLPDTSRFWNNPAIPEEVLQAENEKMKAAIEQIEGQLQAMQNPLAEAETIKQQAFLLKAQQDGQLQIGKMQEDQRQFNADQAEEQRQFNADMALKVEQGNEKLAAQLTELELKYNADVPGALV